MPHQFGAYYVQQNCYALQHFENQQSFSSNRPPHPFFSRFLSKKKNNNDNK